MRLLFIAGMFSDNNRKIVYDNSKGCIQFAADRLQWAYAKGFSEKGNVDLSIWNSLFIGAYPRFYKKAIVRGGKWSHDGKAKNLEIGFLNIFALKQLNKAFVYIFKMLSIGYNRYDVVVAYSMTFVSLLVLNCAKALDMKTCLIVPDLPEYMNTMKSKGNAYSILKKIEITIIKRLMQGCDCCVVLTKHMAEKMRLKKPFLVIEGMVDTIGAHWPEKVVLNTVLYTGTLSLDYGIKDLLSAVSESDGLYELWICGAGEAECEINNYIRRGCRIKYFGQLEREKIEKLQRSAHMLINPRDATGQFTRYSFPSKLLEYMASGRPVLSFKLEGIPEEYFDYLIAIEGAGSSGINNAIKKVLATDKITIEKNGRRAMDFILKEKNYQTQTDKVMNMLREL